MASLERSRELAEALAPTFPEQAAYAVALAYRIRYTMQMNAREAMHLLELRSGPQGHPSYRWVAQEMHRQIAEQAGHRLLAEAMSHVDFGAEDLERLDVRTPGRGAAKFDVRGRKSCNPLTWEVSQTPRSGAVKAFDEQPPPWPIVRPVPVAPKGHLSGLDRTVRRRGGCCERRRKAQGIE